MADDRERMDRYRTRGSTWEREYFAAAMEKNAKWAEQWGEAYDQLEKILTPEEWEAARNSVENAQWRNEIACEIALRVTLRITLSSTWPRLTFKGLRWLPS